MRLVMDTMRLSKIVETAFAANDIGVFEYKGKGVNEEIVITSSSPGQSFCQIAIKKGFLEKVQMEGADGQKFAMDLGTMRKILDDIGVSKSNVVVLKYEDQRIMLGDFELPMIPVPDTSDTLPPSADETIKFRMLSSGLKHIATIASKIDTLLRISLSNGRGGLKGKDIYFSAEEVNEIFTVKGNVGDIVEGKDLFIIWFWVDPLLRIMGETKTGKDEKVEIVVGKVGPLELLLRITEDVIVYYKQAQKIDVGSGTNMEHEREEETTV